MSSHCSLGMGFAASSSRSGSGGTRRIVHDMARFFSRDIKLSYRNKDQ
jgi:hypothetical protein